MTVSTNREIGMKGILARRRDWATMISALTCVWAIGCAEAGDHEPIAEVQGEGFGVRLSAVSAACTGSVLSSGISGKLTASVTGPDIEKPITATGTLASGGD